MLDRVEKIDDLLRYYHRLAIVVLNTYLQIKYRNPLDSRLDRIAQTYSRYACLFNLYVDLGRRLNEARKFNP